VGVYGVWCMSAVCVWVWCMAEWSVCVWYICLWLCVRVCMECVVFSNRFEKMAVESR